MKEYRCTCGKLLFKANVCTIMYDVDKNIESQVIETVCPRCKSKQNFLLETNLIYKAVLF